MTKELSQIHIYVKQATSGLQKFEGPNPVFWCNHGYAIISLDAQGACNSEGVTLFSEAIMDVKASVYF